MPSRIPSALPVVFLRREQLFESVWGTPTVRLAREFGISDVALAKLCHRRNIPLPPRGYWAKLAAGQSLPRPNLPAPRAGEDRPVVVRPVSKIPAVALPPAGERLHPIAERVRRRLLNYKKDYRGLIFVSERGLPCVSVSPATVEKATLAVHLLLTHAEGFQWTIDKDPDTGTLKLRCGRRALGFRIEEETTLLSKPNGRQVRGPTGRLHFFVWGERDGVARMRRWAETGEISFELTMGRLLAALFVPSFTIHRHTAGVGGRLQFSNCADRAELQVG